MASATCSSWQKALSQDKVVFDAKRPNILLEEEARFHKYVRTSTSESSPEASSAQLMPGCGGAHRCLATPVCRDSHMWTGQEQWVSVGWQGVKGTELAAG